MIVIVSCLTRLSATRLDNNNTGLCSRKDKFMTMLKKMINRQGITKYIPSFVSSLIKNNFPTWYYKQYLERLEELTKYSDKKHQQKNGSSRYTLGILKEYTQYHQNYISACQEMDVSYRVIDIAGSNWINVIKESGCDAYLVWPPALMTVWKEMFDERLKVMIDDLEMIIFPTYDELWMWESKRRMRDWLYAHKISTPQTWIFYDFEEAYDFAKEAKIPIVFKTNHGDCSKGVKILRSRREMYKYIRRVFSCGVRLPSSHKCDRQWGSVVFQEYMPDAVEWRLIRVGDSYFGYMKKKIGDYASGSHAGVYADIPKNLLNFIKDITDKNDFYSISLDVMVEPNDKPYVIEVQSLFGCTHDPRKLRVNGKAGRYIFDKEKNNWVFQEGIFDQNICCNLRVEYLLKFLDKIKR